MSWIAKSIGWFARILSWCLAKSPRFVRNGVGYFLAFLWFDLFRIRRDVVTGNIAKAFPETTPLERVRMGRRSLRNLGKNFVEYALLPFLNRDNFETYFRFENMEILDQALQEGRGVILLTLHLGHGDMACAGLSLKGYKIYMVSKFFKLKWLNDLWFGMRRRLGTEFIAPRNSSYALLKALKKNGVVVFPLDQFTGPPIGVRTKFFGIETGTAAGLAVMADRSGAAVVPCYTYRDQDGRHVVRFEGIEHVSLKGDRESNIISATQHFNDLLEGFVRRYPEQWMWIHKRWKTYKY